MASIKDVAQLAGVSFSTVSIIINGRSEERKISKQTQEKVFKAMKELNYQPNISAIKLKKASSRKTIALFWTTDFRDIMLARFLSGLQSQIKKLDLNYDIIIYPYDNDALHKETSLAGLTNFHGAIIANASAKDLAYLESFIPLVPVVLYNRELPNYSSVRVDDYQIGTLAAKILNNNQHITILQAPYVFEGMKVRDTSFIEAISKKDIAYDTFMVTTNTAQGGYEIAKKINYDKTNAIFTASDSIALGVLHYCYQNAIAIPKDVEVLAIGNGLTSIDSFLNPSLSTIQIPMEEMAMECLNILQNMFTTQHVEHRTVNIKLALTDSIRNTKGGISNE